MNENTCSQLEKSNTEHFICHIINDNNDCSYYERIFHSRNHTGNQKHTPLLSLGGDNDDVYLCRMPSNEFLYHTKQVETSGILWTLY